MFSVSETPSSGAGRREQGCRSTVEDRLRRGHHDHDVGLRKCGIDQKGARATLQLDQVGVLDIVHLDTTVETTRELRRDEQLQISMAEPPCQPTRNEQSLPREGHAGPVELAHRRRDRRAPRIAEGTGDRQRGRLHDDGRSGSARNERLQRLTGQRKAERITNSRGYVRDRLDGGRWSEDDGVLVRLDDDELGAHQKRNARH